MWLAHTHNLATVMGLSGRLVEAEVLEKRSLKISRRAVRLTTGSVASASVAGADSVPTAGDRKGSGNVSKIAVDSYRAAGGSRRGSRSGGALLYTEGRYHEAEAEYLKALGAWEESGHGETTDVAALLDSLAVLYVADGDIAKPAGHWTVLSPSSPPPRVQLRRTGSNSSAHELSCMFGSMNGGRPKQTWVLRFRRLTVTRDWTRLYSNPCSAAMRMSSAKIIAGGRLAPSGARSRPQPVN